MAGTRMVVGARISCYINGKLYGRCTSISYSIDTAFKEIRGLDNPVPAELAPTTCRVSWSMEIVRVVGDGGIEAAGMSAPFQDFSNQNYFSILLLDRGSDTVVFRSDTNVVTSQRWQAAAKDLMRGSISGQGLFWNNEIAPVGVR